MVAPIITLTTDFGDRDGFVGVMKGVILARAPEARIVDLAHGISPQDVAAAAFVLASSYRYFPYHAVHVAVVDPGVGTERRALALATPHGTFVGPDNGIFSLVLRDYMTGPTATPQGPPGGATVPVPPSCRAVALTREEYWLHPVSRTFHGRDIFAPAAACLAVGMAPEDLGEPVYELVWKGPPTPRREGDAVHGHVIYVDRFGNLVTDLRAEDLPDGRLTVEIGGRSAPGLASSYAEGRPLAALIGSHGYLEVAYREGSAAQALGVGVGAPATVRPA